MSCDSGEPQSPGGGYVTGHRSAIGTMDGRQETTYVASERLGREPDNHEGQDPRWVSKSQNEHPLLRPATQHGQGHT
jgi:hypothetical protein